MLPRASGSRLFAIAAQCGNLITQNLGSLLITPGEGHCKCKLQLLQLMLPLSRGRWVAASAGSNLIGSRLT